MEDPASAITSSLWGSLNSWFTSTVFFILLNLMIATILFTSNLPNNNNNNQQQQQSNNQEQKDHPQIARSPSILHRLKSFNFLPQQLLIQDDEDDDVSNRHEREPLHVAATQYVFNEPLHYQHFDIDSYHTHQVERASNCFEVDPTRLEMSEVEDAGFEFEPTREEDGRDTGFDFEPTHEDEPTDQFQSLDEVYSKLKGGGGGHHDRTKSDSEIRLKPTTKFKKSASLKLGFSHPDEENTVEARRPATSREIKSAAKAPADDDVEVDLKAVDFINKFKNDLMLQRIESIMKAKGGKK